MTNCCVFFFRLRKFHCIISLLRILIRLGVRFFNLRNVPRASLVAQWLRVCCPCRGHRFEPWSWRIPHAAERLGPCTTATEPALWSSWVTTADAHAPRARVPQWEGPPQWEACAPQLRVAPAGCNWRKPTHSNKDPMQPKINKK